MNRNDWIRWIRAVGIIFVALIVSAFVWKAVRDALEPQPGTYMECLADQDCIMDIHPLCGGDKFRCACPDCPRVTITRTRMPLAAAEEAGQ